MYNNAERMDVFPTHLVEWKTTMAFKSIRLFRITSPGGTSF